MGKATFFKLSLLAGSLLATAIANAESRAPVKAILSEHCIECHRIPGFVEEARNPEIMAPDFQTIADEQKTYTNERLARFLAQPHYPMRRVTLSTLR